MQTYVEAMQPGTNWGNTLDATPDRHAWGAPETTQAMIQGLKAKGYKSLRLPVTWGFNYLGPAPDYTIDPAFMDHVQQVVDWALAADLYVMINMHHDSYWLREMAPDAFAKYQAIWTQVATRFKDYPNKLSFESINEPGFYGANGQDLPADETQAVLDDVNTAFYNIVRGSGGANATRPLVLPTVYTSADQTKIDALKNFMVGLNDPYLIATVHYYGYYPFSVNMGGEIKFGDLEKYWIDTPFNAVHDTFVASGIPVIVGEWGVLAGDSIERGEMLKYHEYVAQYARLKGLTTMLWDTGGVYNRTTQDWQPSNADLAAIIRQGETGRATTSERDLLFLKAGTSNQDTVINLNLNGNTLVSVQDGATTLNPADYTLSGNKLTIKSKVLSKYFTGGYGQKTTLTINSNSGPAWKIYAHYSAPPVVSALTTVSGGELSIPTAFNGDVLATIETKYADGTNAGPVGWSAFPFWGSDFHPDYANNAIVLSSGYFSGAPANSIVNLAFYFWSGKVLTYQIQIKPASSEGSTDLVIYGDSMASGWSAAGGWGGWGAFEDLASTTTVHSGATSISTSPVGWAGLLFGNATPVDTSIYHTLVFWINGGPTGGQNLGFGVVPSGDWNIHTNWVNVRPVANTWQKVEVSLASLGVQGRTDIDHFYFQDWSGGGAATFYLDDIKLTTAYPSTAMVLTGTANGPTPFSITRSGFTLNRRTNRMVQTVTVRNTSSNTVTGPTYLVLDSLSSNTILANATGTTSKLVPTGSPYVQVTAGSLAPQASVSVSLEFTVPASGGITYDARTSSGSAP